MIDGEKGSPQSELYDSVIQERPGLQTVDIT
jgi:hypothetical protein